MQQGDLCICTVVPTKLQIAPACCLLLIFNQSTTTPCNVTVLQQTWMIPSSNDTPQNAEGDPPKHSKRDSGLSAVTLSAVISSPLVWEAMSQKRALAAFSSLSHPGSTCQSRRIVCTPGEVGTVSLVPTTRRQRARELPKKKKKEKLCSRGDPNCSRKFLQGVSQDWVTLGIPALH